MAILKGLRAEVELHSNIIFWYAAIAHSWHHQIKFRGQARWSVQHLLSNKNYFTVVVATRDVVTEPFQFSNQLLLPNRQLASKGIINQLQKNQVEMKHKEESWQKAEKQFMIRNTAAEENRFETEYFS